MTRQPGRRGGSWVGTLFLFQDVGPKLAGGCSSHTGSEFSSRSWGDWRRRGPLSVATTDGVLRMHELAWQSTVCDPSLNCCTNAASTRAARRRRWPSGGIGLSTRDFTTNATEDLRACASYSCDRHPLALLRGEHMPTKETARRPSSRRAGEPHAFKAASRAFGRREQAARVATGRRPRACVPSARAQNASQGSPRASAGRSATSRRA